MNVFKTGDVVRLKSGGEGKTVLTCEGGRTTTVFMDWNARTERRDGYPTECLMLMPSVSCFDTKPLMPDMPVEID